MLEAREKLESEMEDAYHEHQANLLRQGKFSGAVRFNKETEACNSWVSWTMFEFKWHNLRCFLFFSCYQIC